MLACGHSVVDGLADLLDLDHTGDLFFFFVCVKAQPTTKAYLDFLVVFVKVLFNYGLVALFVGPDHRD